MFKVPSFELPAPLDMSNFKSLPEWAFEAIKEEIEQFQAGLGADHDIGIIVSGAQSAIHASRVRLADQMIVFEGVDEENRIARVIAHYTQVNFRLVAVPKIEANARRIGF
ncbi:hypothetical protein [Sphingomonas oryzagri]|uniref:Uncharacterized protein n=1 Tax=Sphingomonas oryzagri TaxID=3042314 RepID=A0ABT6N7U6_9SPHN|nr:hypothetical protein [Sphingomonas oryzagri]MDH7641151.1 hypothetical protein [Sphingomonas oryzagri]